MEDSYESGHDKTNKVAVRPVKTQISLGIRPVWSESSLSAWRNLGSSATHWMRCEDWSDWADAQADLSLRWTHTHFVGFVMRWLLFIIFWNNWFAYTTVHVHNRMGMVSVGLNCQPCTLLHWNIPEPLGLPLSWWESEWSTDCLCSQYLHLWSSSPCRGQELHNVGQSDLLKAMVTR